MVSATNVTGRFPRPAIRTIERPYRCVVAPIGYPSILLPLDVQALTCESASKVSLWIATEVNNMEGTCGTPADGASALHRGGPFYPGSPLSERFRVRSPYVVQVPTSPKMLLLRRAVKIIAKRIRVEFMVS